MKIILNLFAKYWKLSVFPLLAILQWPMENFGTLFLVWFVDFMVLVWFLLELYWIVYDKEYPKIIPGLISIAIGLCFWFEIFKSPAIARGYFGGDMQDAFGKIVFRKNGTCEVWRDGLFQFKRKRCICSYSIRGDSILVDGCEVWRLNISEIEMESKKFKIVPEK